MEFNDLDITVDPDYQANNSAIRQAELNHSEDDRDSIEKLNQVIKDEFDKELTTRRKHIENIEEHLFKAQKLLHLVRYALVTQYYNNKSLQVNSDEFEDKNTLNFDRQNRIHPAVKKLLGTNNSLQVIHRGKRKTKSFNSTEPMSSSSEAASEEPAAKKIKLESLDLVMPKVIPNSSNVRNRKKVKQRIILGNISKYMPSREIDTLTHKWMVYVRGPKENPDVSHFIQKVVYYLHPSYKPYDVVEITESPFHLARRGWGEFPIRVQISFKNSLNKPVDLVHNLKLDQKHTGRQTLGGETIVDLYLHEEGTEAVENNNLDSLIKAEESDEVMFEKSDVTFGTDIKLEVKESTEEINTFNHDHYFGDVFTSNNLMDHTYSLPHYLEGTKIKTEETDDNLVSNPDTPLIYGLDDSFTNKKVSSIKNSNKESSINHIENKSLVKNPIVKVLTNNLGKNIYLVANTNNSPFSSKNFFLLKTKHPQSVLKTVHLSKVLANTVYEPKIDYNEFKVDLPQNTFKNMGEVLPYLFKKLPLCNKLASNLNYKCTYPYTATSLKEYSNFNIGKKLSAEWSRAKMIKRVLKENGFLECNNWNTKAILMYGRCHIFTPLTTYGIFNNSSDEKSLILKCYDNSVQLHKTRKFNDRLKEENVNIDILSLNQEMSLDSDDSLQKNSENIDISDVTLKPHCSFIRHTVLNSGIVLKPEEICPNVVFNGAERMMLEAVKCLAENLIRRASCHLICNGYYTEGTSQISREHVELAINERKEILAIKNFQKRKNELEFFM